MMREIERQVMLNIIDQHWREHLLEMDYLEEGIHLRAMGQKDPLVEWQREGFEMFGAMMHSIAQDFVKYVMHVQVVEEDRHAAPGGRARCGTRRRRTRRRRRARWSPPPGPRPRPRAPRSPPELAAEAEVVNAPVVKSDWDKTPRNAPCPCGSGKKFKQCHGA